MAPITGELAAMNTEWTAPQWGGLEFYLAARSEWDGGGDCREPGCGYRPKSPLQPGGSLGKFMSPL